MDSFKKKKKILKITQKQGEKENGYNRQKKSQNSWFKPNHINTIIQLKDIDSQNG